MAFPDDILPITVELDLDGTWTDISSDVYERDAVRITRGRSDEGRQVDPGTCQLTLTNLDGKYSPRNPTSPYFGIIGRNTPIRVSADGGLPALLLTGGASDSASTPDAAALDLTGDMEIQIEISHDTWEFDNDVALAGKWLATGDQRSYLFALTTDLEPAFLRTTLGTAASTQSDIATEALSIPPSGRLALKFEFDIDNGAGSSECTMYTSDSIDGTWTQLGSVLFGSTTATFDSTATLTAGSGGAQFASWDGRIHKLRVLDGIGGSAVADVDFTAQTVADTSFVDDAGLTWTVNGDAALSNRKTRFYGEVSEWPVRWSTGGHDVYVPIVASGILRRLGQGASPLQSALRRAVPTSDSVIAYWPMEDGDSATQFASPIAGVRPMGFTNFDPASIDTLPGSSSLPTVSSSSGGLISFTGAVPASTSNEARVEFVYRHDTAPTTLRTYMRVLTTGSIREWYLQMNDSQSRIIGRDVDGTDVVTNDMAWGATEPFGAWWRIVFTLIQDGSDIDYAIAWYRDGESTLTDSGTASSETFGRISTVAGPPAGISTDLDGMGLGHVAVFDSVTVADDFTDADQGYTQERAGARLTRLGTEESIPVHVYGTSSEQAELGPQRPEELLTLLRECADADAGILYENRARLGVAYRDRGTLYNQTVALTLDYEGDDGLVVPLDPTDDDQQVRNDVTVQRTDGGFGYAVEDEGPLSTNLPPDGVGRYAESVTRNLYSDDQAEQHAGWLLHLGTWDEARYPTVSILLQNAPGMIEQAAAVDIGDRMQITNPPAWLPPETIDQLVQGYTELLHQYRWELTFNTSPAGPWTVGVADDSDAYVDTDGSTLASAATSSGTSLSVLTQVDSALWATSTVYPGDYTPGIPLRVGGEVVTATAVTSSAVDAFGGTSSGSWGDLDIGGTWTDDGGSAADYDVGSGYGSHTLATKGVTYRSFVASPSADVDVYADTATSALATGSSLFGGLVARYVDLSNMYMARLEFTTGAVIFMSLRKRVAGVDTSLGSFNTGVTHTATTFYRMRFQLSGSALRGKFWLPADVEPVAWQLEATDTSFTAAGSVGFRSTATVSNTNSNPELRYDNFEVVNPQTFTVTRSVNGVSKSHDSGADIRLNQPTYVAL